MIIIVFVFIAYLTFIKKILKEKSAQHQLELNHQKEIASQQIYVQENERKRIAKAIHDDIGNKLNVLSLWVNNNDTSNTKRSKEIISKLIPELIDTARAISHSLFPVNLEKLGLILTIETLISNINNKALTVNFVSNDYKKRPISFEVEIYRVIQEFLSNVIKHSKATQMLIHIRQTEDSLSIILSDNGIGFDSSKIQNGMGFKNIESRIKSLNGKVKWRTKKDKGVRLISKLPSYE